MKFGQVTLLILGLLAVAGGALAQDRKPITLEEKRRMVVSARAGEINLVEGDVSTRAAQDWSLLVPGDVVKDGDQVRTGPGSRAEVLLNPGSYLRLSENTEFKFESTSIDRIKINLIAGSAIVEEAAGENSAGVLATVITPKAQFSIVKAGVYRFNVDPSGRAEARVAKGRLTTGTVEVREGREAVVGDAGSELLAIDNKATDTFDAWSKDRAKSLVAANGNLARTDVNLMESRYFLPFGSGFGPTLNLWSSRFGWLGSCSGLWYFDPFFGSFIYLPDGFGACSPFFSPYGYPYQACYYPPTGGGYVEEPDPGKKPGKHPRPPKQPGGPLPASAGNRHTGTLAGREGGRLGHAGTAGLASGAREGRPTIGHNSPSYSASHASVVHSGGGGSIYSGGSAGHVSSASSTAASSSAATSSGGGGHHGHN